MVRRPESAEDPVTGSRSALCHCNICSGLDSPAAAPLLRSGRCIHKRQMAEPPQLCPQRSGARSRICKLVLLVLPLCLPLSRLSRLMASWISPFREVESSLTASLSFNLSSKPGPQNVPLEWRTGPLVSHSVGDQEVAPPLLPLTG